MLTNGDLNYKWLGSWNPHEIKLTSQSLENTRLTSQVVNDMELTNSNLNDTESTKKHFKDTKTIPSYNLDDTKHLLTKREKRKKKKSKGRHTITPDEFALVVERRTDPLEAVALAVPTLVPCLLVDIHRACSVEAVAEFGDVALGLGLAT